MINIGTIIEKNVLHRVKRIEKKYQEKINIDLIN